MLYYSTIAVPTLLVLKKLLELPSLQNTRLVGGTALALQIGHRKSVDIDLFGEVSSNPDTIMKELSTVGESTVYSNSKNIHIYILDGIKVDIVNYQREWLNEPLYTDNIRMASLEDICAMKLSAVTGRGSKRDFIDIYFLAQQYSLEEMLAFYSRKYPEVSLLMVLRSLSYFEDAERDSLPDMLKAVTWEQVKEAILTLL
jgi:predicted nucleotidyltransferase component of viral defense system